MLQATNDSKDKLLLVSFTLLEFCREKMIEMCNFRWKTSHATISYSSGGGWKNKRRLRSMSITVETRFVFNVKFYQDVLGQCTSMKRRVSIWNGSRHKTFTLVGHGCGKPNFNTLHPNNSMHIPHTVRHTFPEVLTRRICLKIYPVVGDQRIK